MTQQPRRASMAAHRPRKGGVPLKERIAKGQDTSLRYRKKPVSLKPLPEALKEKRHGPI